MTSSIESTRTTFQAYITCARGAGALDDDIFYKRNILLVIEPRDLGELMDTSRLAHLRDLYGPEQSDAYTEIQSVRGYAEIRALLESKGYVFLDYNISEAEGSVLNQTFSARKAQQRCWWWL